MRRTTQPAEKTDELPQTFTATRPLTPAHKALITILAESAVAQYLARRKVPVAELVK
jgi:hypothetical protein